METKVKPILKVDWCAHDAAKFACKYWHYSKSVPVPPLLKIGVWENNSFIGAIIFSRGASSNLLKPYGLKVTQGCELTRVALTKHYHPVSKILAIAIKFLKRNSPTLRLIVSFADKNEGHHGGIYQATNWIYTGMSNKSIKYVDKYGREGHSRQVSEKGYNIQQSNYRKTVKPSECKKILQEGKYRYLMPLDDEMRDIIKSLSKPYPKRVTSIENDADSDQESEGGVIPTVTLQSSSPEATADG